MILPRSNQDPQHVAKAVVIPPFRTLAQAERDALFAAVQRHPEVALADISHRLGVTKTTFLRLLRVHGLYELFYKNRKITRRGRYKRVEG